MLSFLVDENQHRLFLLNKQTCLIPDRHKRIECSWKLACGLDLKFNVPKDAGSLALCFKGNKEVCFWYLCYSLKMRFLRTDMKRLFKTHPTLNPNVMLQLLSSFESNLSVHQTPFWYLPRSDLCELKDGDMTNGQESWILEVLYMGSSIVLRTALQVLSRRMYLFPGSDFTAISKWMIYMVSASEDVGLIKMFFESGLIQRMDSKHCGNLLAVTDTHAELFQTMIEHRSIKLQFQRSDTNLNWILQSIKNGSSRLVLPWLTKGFILNKESVRYSDFLFDWLFTLTGLRYCDATNVDSIIQLMLHVLSGVNDVAVPANPFGVINKKKPILKIRHSIHLNVRDPAIAERFYLLLKIL